MATLVLGYAGAAVGGYFGGPAGAAAGQIVGGMLGAYIDRQYVFPAVFGTDQQNIQGNRLGDLTSPTAHEGAVMYWFFGPENRVPGEYIWLPDLTEEESTDDVGGKGGGGGPTITNYAYFLNAAISFGESKRITGVSSIQKIWADSKLIYSDGQPDARIEGLRIYLGTNDQMPDSLIESIKGVGEVPGYRGSVYIVIERMALRDWGNRPPAFRALIADEETKSVGSAILDLCVLAGLSADEVDVTGVPGCLCGFPIAGPQTVTSLIEVLMTKEQLNVSETDGILRFYAKGDEPLLAVQFDEMAAHESGSDTSRNYDVQDNDGRDLPSEVNVQYQDPEIDFQQGSKKGRHLNPQAINPVQISLPIVIPGAEARALAETILWSAQAERQVVAFNLPPSYMYLQEGNVVQFTDDDDETWTVRLEEIERGDNFLLRVQGVTVEQHVFARDGDSDPPVTPEGEIYSPPTITLVQMNLAPLRGSDVTIPGYYWAACATDPDAMWLGGAVYSSSDNVTYALMASIGVESVIGEATTELADGPVGYWDNVNTVTVELLNGELTSKTAAEVLNGANRAMVGDEHIGFQTATLVGTRTYTLSGLIRGRRDTRSFRSTHAVGDLFVLLSPSQTKWQPVELPAIDAERFYKPVPTYGIVADTDEQTFTPNAQTMKQFAPVFIAGSRDGSDNLTLTWTRRSRGIVRLLGPITPPLYSLTEAYEIDVLDGVDVVRTITSSSPTCAYSAAEQTSDGLTPGDPVSVRVYQMTTDYGRGNPGEATV